MKKILSILLVSMYLATSAYASGYDPYKERTKQYQEFLDCTAEVKDKCPAVELDWPGPEWQLCNARETANCKCDHEQEHQFESCEDLNCFVERRINPNTSVEYFVGACT